MPNITGTPGEDTLDDTTGIDTIDGLGGNDTIRSYHGPDTIFGGTGNDTISITRSNDGFSGTVTVDGGADDDFISVSNLHVNYSVNATGGTGQDQFYVRSAAGAVFFDGGADNDLFLLAEDVASATLTLGSGQDVLRFMEGGSTLSTHVTVVDFTVGDSGDRIDWGNYLQLLIDWTPTDNPFATNHFILQTVGSDVTLYIDRDGGGALATLYQVITFQNVSAASLTAYNLGGYPTNGGPPVGVTINGTPGADNLYGAGGNDTINGGEGSDFLTGRAGNDVIYGDGGDDILNGELGDDMLYGGLGDDRIDDHLGINSIYGEAGNDRLFASAGLLDGGDDDDQLFLFGNGVDARGGSGADRITLDISGFGPGTHAIDAGDGDDTIILAGGRSAGALLGTGTDTITFTSQYQLAIPAGAFVVDDFETGDGGDKIDIEGLFLLGIENWNGHSNPFSTDHLRLAAGALPNQVDLYFDADGLFGAAEKLLITFNNVTLATFTAFNFSGYSHTGAAPTSVDLVGTADGETLNGGYGHDHLQGLGGDDTLIGSLGSDHLDGGEGNDTISGSFGGDYLQGGAGNDDIDGGANNDQIEGNDGNDRLRGGSDSDHLSGNDGNDDLNGGSGSDILLGGNGDDVLTDDFGTTGDDELLRGGDGNDTLLVVRAGPGYLPSSSVTMEGGAGNDVITLQGVDQSYAQLVDATMDGGDGDDILRTTGVDSAAMLAGAGNDRVELLAIGQAINASIKLGIGSDTIVVRPTGIGSALGNRTVVDFKAGDGGDILIVLDSGIGNPYPSGGVSLVQQGAHTLVKVQGHTLVTLQNVRAADLSSYNLNGFDSGFYSPIAHNITGTAGDDDFGGADLNDDLNGGGGNDVIFGAGGNDTLRGGEGNDILQGGSGNDTLFAGPGGDQIEGGTGNDVYYVDSPAALVFEAVGGGTDIIYAGTSYDLLAGQEIETLSTNDYASTAAINLTGNLFDQVLIGNAGANILHGGGGVDTLIGLGGNDVYYVDVAGTQIAEAAGAGNDVVYASLSYTLSGSAEVETLSTNDYGSTAAINLTGNSLNQILIGNAGDNALHGGGGNDVLIGLAGNDVYYVDVAATQIAEATGAGADTVYASVSYTLGGGAEVETMSTNDYGSTTALNLTGNAFNQILIGNSGANVLHGGGGVDTLIGLGGNDVYYVDVAGTQVSEAAGGGTDAIYTSISYTLAAGNEVEILSSNNYGATDAISLTGNGSNQVVTGNAGANTLNGGAGADTLHGLGGADNFAFTTALGGGNVDSIADFSVADDTIQLDDAIFAALGAPGALNPNAFVTGSAAGDADDRIIYNSATGQLLYDADGNGGGAAVQFATLGTGLALTANDFQVI